MTETHKGVLYMIAACTIWGLASLYYAAMAHFPPILIIAHRTIWSLVFFAALLLFQGRLKVLGAALTSGRKQLAQIAAAATTVSINWFTFVFAVTTGQALEASVGYYIFPLVAVSLGAFFLKERLTSTQWLAVAFGALAVLVLTIGLGVAPWIALVVSTSFGLYGLLKKGLNIGPVVSVTAEVLLLSPIALITLLVMHREGVAVFGSGLHDILLLMGSGLLTGVPLVFFSAATRRISYATIGLLQYVNPTLQILVAVLLLGGVFTLWHAIALSLIWTALTLYSLSAFQTERKRLREAKAASIVSTG